VLHTPDARKFVSLLRQLKTNPVQAQSMHRAGRATAKQYAWPDMIERLFLPRLDLLRSCPELRFDDTAETTLWQTPSEAALG